MEELLKRRTDIPLYQQLAEEGISDHTHFP